MAVLYVTEFQYIGRQGGSDVQLPLAPAQVFNNNVAIGAQAQSNAFGSKTNLIRVHADAICSVAVGGTNPIATAADARFAANQTEYFFVIPGHKLSVISNT